MELIFLLAILVAEFNINEIISRIGEFVSKYSGPIAIGVAIVIFLLQQHKTKKDKKEEFNERLRRICITLLIDMNEFDKWLFNDDVLKVKKDNIEYTQNMLSEENHHSVINSGLIIYFQEKTQVELSKLYHYIALHNKRIEGMTSISHINSQDGERVWNLHEEQLALYETELKNRLPVRHMLSGSYYQLLPRVELG